MRAIVLGRTGGPEELTLTEVPEPSSCTHRDVTDVAELVREGKLAPVIDRVIGLEGAADAHRVLAERGVVGRIVMRI